MNTSSTSNVWCIVPAAGIGSRMKSDVPKQYLAFQSSTLIEFTLKRLMTCQRIQRIVVALDSEDSYWDKTSYTADQRVITTHGGNERADSVLNALQALKAAAELNVKSDDWVLVHDAARPCVMATDINLLIDHCMENDTGAILASPIIDTIKLVKNQNKIQTTVKRDDLWRAFTPQIFKLAALETALITAKNAGFIVTDEASAMENMGYQPLIVEGRADNIKVTSPTDLNLANYIIKQQEQQLCE